MRYEETKKMISKGKINYSATFQAVEAIKQEKLNPSVPVKAADKDKSLVMADPFIMDVESETDRRLLCSKILS